MPYRPRPSFNAHIEDFLKGHAHFYGDKLGRGTNGICKYIVDAVKEKMEREPKGKIEMMKTHWNRLTEDEKKDSNK